MYFFLFPGLFPLFGRYRQLYLTYYSQPLLDPFGILLAFLTYQVLSSCRSLARAGPLLGAERAGPGGGCLNTPRLTPLMGHVATRGKRHSKERQKS